MARKRVHLTEFWVRLFICVWVSYWKVSKSFRESPFEINSKHSNSFQKSFQIAAKDVSTSSCIVVDVWYVCKRERERIRDRRGNREGAKEWCISRYFTASQIVVSSSHLIPASLFSIVSLVYLFCASSSHAFWSWPKDWRASSEQNFWSCLQDLVWKLLWLKHPVHIRLGFAWRTIIENLLLQDILTEESSSHELLSWPKDWRASIQVFLNPATYNIECDRESPLLGYGNNDLRVTEQLRRAALSDVWLCDCDLDSRQNQIWTAPILLIDCDPAPGRISSEQK